MWQWQAARPMSTGRSRLFDGRPQPGQRVAQIFVRDLGEARGDARRCFGVGRGRGLAGLAGQAALAAAAARPTACQPKKRFTRSSTTPERCWISIAVGPSTRSTRVPGSGVRPSAARGHWIFSGSEWAAISAPTISAQRVTSSVEAKPCLAKASLSVLCRRSASGRGYDLPGLFTRGLCHIGRP